MEVNDTPETDTTRFQLTGTGQEVFLEDDGEDVHVCRKCNIFFYDIQKYLEHKVKHDNCKVKYCRSEVDKRMVFPRLVDKQATKKQAASKPTDGNGIHKVQETEGASQTAAEGVPQAGEEKENEGQKKRGRRGRKKAVEVDQELVITEKPVYACEKCSKKFNREAALRRHKAYDHKDEDDDEEEEEETGGGVHLEVDDDQDEDYRPKLDIKEELQDATEVGDAEEMATLDRVIMAAAIMEQDGAPITVDTFVQQVVGQEGPTPAKQQRLSEQEMALRKYVCHVCGSKFKELPVLKTHQLTHTARRDYRCQYDGCTYSFKTKGSLKRHMRRHTGERPYPCELCGRSFAESGALTRHQKSRAPCTTKTDNELPRYGKKWTYEPKIPAAGAGEGKPNTIRTKPHQQSDTLQLNKDTIIEEVSEISVGLETEKPEEEGINTETLTNVVRVLEDSLPDVQHKQLFELDDAEGVEIVIEEGESVEECLTEDNLAQLVQPEAPELEGSSFSASVVCKVCKEDFVSVDGLKAHLRTHLADTDCHCWMCHFFCTSKEEFENHLMLQHHLQLKNNDPFPSLVGIDDVKKTPPVKDKSEIHRDAQTAVKQLLFLSQDQADDEEEEQKEPGDRRLYKCVVCQRRFRGSNYLKLHMRNHTGLRPYKCDECGKGFITKDTLTKHMTSHADDRNFKCGECGKLFKRLSHVREHLKIHSGSRPYPCTVCDKSFKTNNAMKVHLRTHTDILPYECSYCHRRFREKGSVIRHMRMHTGEKPYECQHCGRGFAEHGTLNRHLKAKVSCNKQLQEVEEQQPEDYTVLAEFSSVVADTQQYIMEGVEEQVEESIVHEETQQAAEYVVLQTGVEGEDIHNVEIITEDGEQSKIGSIQVTDDYIVVSEPGESGMKIISKTTGELIAVVPTDTIGDDSQVQTITMSQDGEVSMVTLMPGTDASQEGIETLIEDGTIIQGTIIDHEQGLLTLEHNSDVVEQVTSDDKEKDLVHQNETVTQVSAGESISLPAETVAGGSDILHADGIQSAVESTQGGIQQVLDAAEELESGHKIVYEIQQGENIADGSS